MKDLVGKRFGYLTVESFADIRNNFAYWNCRCDCGNIKIVRGTNLTQSKVISCGCKKHIGNTTHGESKTRLYSIWAGMRQRCENANRKDYRKYGGRGIEVCDEWQSFTVFSEWANANGYDDSKSIDRIDADRGYCPSNCRWVDFQTQQNNKMNSCTLTVNGETKTAAEWSKVSGISAARIRRRKKLNWSDERSVFEPIDETHKHEAGGS